jgi:hypothetical protein
MGQQRVEQRLQAILGVSPTRSDLVRIAERLGWGPLSREEKRVKTHLLARLESRAAAILTFLETREGIRALETAYVHQIKGKDQVRPSHHSQRNEAKLISRKRSDWITDLPPETTISFYINAH